MVHHAFEVEGSGREHDIDVVAGDAKVKVAAEAVACFQVADDRLNGGSSAEAFLQLGLLVMGQLFLIEGFRNLNQRVPDFAFSFVASVDRSCLRCSSGQAGGLLECFLQDVPVVLVSKAQGADNHAGVLRMNNRNLVSKLVLFMLFAFGDALHHGLMK